LDELEQPVMLSATSATRGRSVRMALSPTVVMLPATASARPPHDHGGGGMRPGTHLYGEEVILVCAPVHGMSMAGKNPALSSPSLGAARE
jgi:hypothetical protein